MLSRRVIELLACGINVVSNDSLAMQKMFPGIVQVCHTVLIQSPDRENRYVNSLLESAMIVKKEIFNKVKLNDAIANGFQAFFEDCRKNGCKIYSVDRFNFVNIKQAMPQDLIQKCTVVGCTDNFKTYTDL